MQPNATTPPLPKRQFEAARLVAEDELSDQQIANQIGINKSTLERWKRDAAFSGAVARIAQELEAETLRFAIAKRRNRVKALDDRWKRMQRLIDERADDTSMVGVAGGRTGLLVHQERAIGTGSNQQIIDEYAVDTGLLKELREHERQAAQEIGQWLDKSQVVVDDAGLSDDDRAARIAALLDAARARRAGQPAPEPD